MLMRRAARHHLAGELREAASLYRKILQDDPQHSGALHALGVMAHQTGRGDAAEKLLLRAVATNPAFAAAHDDLGALWLLQGKTDQAAAAFSEAIRVEPRYALAHAHLGAALSTLGRHDEAAVAYQRAVDAAVKSVRRFKGVGIDVSSVTENLRSPSDADGQVTARGLSLQTPASVGGTYGQYLSPGEQDTASVTPLSAGSESPAGPPDDDEDDEGVVGLTLVSGAQAETRPMAPLAARAEELGLVYASMAGVAVSASSAYPRAIPDQPFGPHDADAADQVWSTFAVTEEPWLGLSSSDAWGLEPAAVAAWAIAGGDEAHPTNIDPGPIPELPADPPGLPSLTPNDESELSLLYSTNWLREPEQDLPVIEAEVGDPRFDAPQAMAGGMSTFSSAVNRPVPHSAAPQSTPAWSGFDTGRESNGYTVVVQSTVPASPPEPTLFDIAIEPPRTDDRSTLSSGETPAAVTTLSETAAPPTPTASATTIDPATTVVSTTGVVISPSEIIDVGSPTRLRVEEPAAAFLDVDDVAETEQGDTEAEGIDPADDAEEPAPDGVVKPPAVSRVRLPESASRMEDDPVLAPRLLAKELRRARRKPVAGARQAAELHKQGASHLRQRRVEEAIAALERLVELQPTSAKAHRDLGAAYIRADRFDDAVVSLQRALELRPRFADAFASLGDAFHLQGRVEEAINCYRQTLALRPSATSAHSNLLLNLNYQRKNDAQTLFAEHLKWAKAHASPLTAEILRHENSPSAERQIRVGYVSGDFRRHAVGSFIEPILANRDPAAFHIICYSDVLRPDDATERLSAMADGWRDIRGLTDIDVCDMIRHDQIDILVDLAGHTASNRLCVFARKPAPVQITYLGYPNTTGLGTMDYRLTDTWADPLGQTEQFHTEQLYRLPRGFLCYQGPADAPVPSAPPIVKNGFVTFGCFNILAKLTPETLGLWAKIMTVLPNSRMVLKDRLGTFANPARRRYVQDIFAYHRIAADRLELLSKDSDRQKHMESYSKVDVMLDPFPYNGTTTTCEALWMGVPVITLAGTRHASRVGVSILKSAGLPEFVSPNIEGYARSAVLLARDVNRLVLLRRTLRQKITASSLCDAGKFTKYLGAAYREMWTYWCQTRGAPMLPPSDRLSLEG